ncbi:MAG: diguanylate cyclase [Desulfobacterales bacterium]|nr:diguanylate cyclase [Desulfobacterales bacterium]
MKLLIAEDDSMTRLALRKNLKRWGYDVLETKDGAEAWNMLSAEDPPRIAILDWMMPGMEGIDICKLLHESDKTPFIYTILLTSRADKEDIVEALDNGAYDFLSKPVHSAELRSRIAVGVRLVEADDKLREYAAEMERLATTDSLTGLYNRRYFFEKAGKELELAMQNKTQLSLILMDIDHFKKVNDTYGHFAGDEALKALTACCKETLYDYDLFSRFGGEEFAILLPGTDKDTAFKLAEQMRKVIGEISIDFTGQSFNVTVSIGVASMDNTGESLETILKRADDAMYQAKKNGRNQALCG